ncbi:Spermatoproteinsis-associated protein 17 [Sparganum proliferum]
MVFQIQEDNDSAIGRIRIQKHWRGYFSRKHNGDFYKRKQYLDGVRKASLRLNEITKAECQSKESTTSLAEFEQKKRLVENWAIKNHHLISTYSQPGAYQVKGYEEVDSVLLPSVNILRTSQTGCHQTKSQICKSQEVKLQRKFQGPFRSAADVASQRRKTLSPTLRVMTDFYSAKQASEKDRLHSWIHRLNDKSFTFGRPTPLTYTKVITAEGNYCPPAYGRIHFRSAIDSDKNDKKLSNAFKTTLPPIPIFSRLDKEYFPRYVMF